MVYKDSIIKKLEKEYKLIHKHLVAYPNKNKIEQSISVYGFEGDEILIYLERSKLLESFEEVADDEYASSDVSRDVKSNAVNVYVLYTNEKEFEKVLGMLERQETEKKNNINLIVGTPGEGYTLREFTTKLPSKEIDLELNYGKEFVKKHETIIERLNQQNGSGLVVLNGKPGTGKTTYIKYLTTQIEKRIIFVPPSMAESLTGPNLLPFLMENKNSILIIEDAEKVIGCRESSETNNSVSNILNMTDGILGDCLSLQVIATLNTPREKIDKALLRKGRLIAEHEFKELPEENVKRLFEKLKVKKDVTKPMTLTEIYNHDEDDQVTESKKYIGFQ
jgi:broad-specificity NMP kinase